VRWDGTGLRLFAKRLERHRFAWPPLVDEGVVLTPAQFALRVGAIDWRRTVVPPAAHLPVQMYAGKPQKRVFSVSAGAARLVHKTMSPRGIDIPEGANDVRELFAAMQARLVASEQALEAERNAHQTTHEQLDAAKNAVKLTTPQMEKLKAPLARMGRMKFGQSPERLTLLADQFELTLKYLEAEHAHAPCVVAGDAPPELP